MTQPKPIVNFEFMALRVRLVEIEGAPWFIAADVAVALGYSDTDQAIRQHCKAAESCPVNSTGQVRQMKIIPERDVYRLIMRSTLPTAERFEEWVVGEVLPSVRQHGGYIAGQESETDPAVIIARALRVADNVIAQKDRELAAAQNQLAAAQPAVQFVENYVEARSTKSLREAAKVLGQREREFISRLHAEGIIFKQSGSWYPVAQFQHRGLFAVKTGEANGHAFNQTRFTPAGIAWIAKRFGLLGAA